MLFRMKVAETGLDWSLLQLWKLKENKLTEASTFRLWQSAILTLLKNLNSIWRYSDFVSIRSFDYQFDDSLETKIGFNAPLFGSKNETDEKKKHWNVVNLRENLHFLNTIHPRNLFKADSVNYWMDAGLPSAKIVIGIPIFGNKKMCKFIWICYCKKVEAGHWKMAKMKWQLGNPPQRQNRENLQNLLVQLRIMKFHYFFFK